MLKSFKFNWRMFCKYVKGIKGTDNSLLEVLAHQANAMHILNIHIK